MRVGNIELLATAVAKRGLRVGQNLVFEMVKENGPRGLRALATVIGLWTGLAAPAEVCQWH